MDWRLKAMKGYPTLHRTQGLYSHHRMQFIIIHRISLFCGVFPLYTVYPLFSAPTPAQDTPYLVGPSVSEQDIPYLVGSSPSTLCIPYLVRSSLLHRISFFWWKAFPHFTVYPFLCGNLPPSA